MKPLTINAVVTLKGFTVDKNGNPTANFSGDTGIAKLSVAVGDGWRDFDMANPYLVETKITPAQTDFDDLDGKEQIDFEEAAPSTPDYLLPTPEVDE